MQLERSDKKTLIIFYAVLGRMYFKKKKWIYNF